MKFKRIIAAVMTATMMFSALSVNASATLARDENGILYDVEGRAKYEKLKAKVDTMVEDVVKKANKEDNHWERFKIIYDYVLDNLEYDWDKYQEYLKGKKHLYSYEFDGAACLLRGKAVCAGYANTIEYLCEKCGITCITLSSGKINHEWNQVRIYNNWYNVDACWSDCVSNRYTWFLKTDAQFAKRHGYSATEKRTNPCVTEYDVNNPPSPPENFVEDIAIYYDGVLYEYQNIVDKTSINLSVGKKVKLGKLVSYDSDDVKVYFSNTKRAKLVKSKSGTLYVKGLKKGSVFLVVVSGGKRTNIRLEVK